MSIVIVGAGPNLGMAIARRFGREGLAVGLTSRNQEKLEGLVAELTELTDSGITAAAAAADIRDPAALAAAIQTLASRLGPVEILEYSPVPAGEFMKPILETTADDLRGPLEVSVLGAATAVHTVLESMRDAGQGRSCSPPAPPSSPATRNAPASACRSLRRSPTPRCCTKPLRTRASTWLTPRSTEPSVRGSNSSPTQSPTSSGTTTPPAKASRPAWASTSRSVGVRISFGVSRRR
jgi:hypothetical protein